MLEKTKMIFENDLHEMWISWIKFKRSSSSVIAIFEKYISGDFSIDMSFNRGVFRIALMVPDEFENDEEKQEYDEEFQRLVKWLINDHFDPAYDPNNHDYSVMVSMDNFVQALTEKR